VNSLDICIPVALDRRDVGMSTLPHIWPVLNLILYDMDSFLK
jgi:hypothetical protein